METTAFKILYVKQRIVTHAVYRAETGREKPPCARNDVHSAVASQHHGAPGFEDVGRTAKNKNTRLKRLSTVDARKRRARVLCTYAYNLYANGRVSYNHSTRIVCTRYYDNVRDVLAVQIKNK